MAVDAARIDGLPLPSMAIDFLRDAWGIAQLHPPQAQAMPPLLDGRNLLLAIPTASGKSLVAYIAMLHRLLVVAPGSRAVYIVPLKALASEKHEELTALAEAVGLSVGLGIGDAAEKHNASTTAIFSSARPRNSIPSCGTRRTRWRT